MHNNLIYSNEPCRHASFITSKGSFINLQENRVELVGYCGKDVTHSDLLTYLKRNDINEKDLIRINDGSYIYISEEAYILLNEEEPNQEQYTAILKWLDFLSLNSKKNYICIGIHNRSNRLEFLNKTHPDGLLPEDIIKEIKRYYIK